MAQINNTIWCESQTSDLFCAIIDNNHYEINATNDGSHNHPKIIINSIAVAVGDDDTYTKTTECPKQIKDWLFNYFWNPGAVNPEKLGWS